MKRAIVVLFSIVLVWAFTAPERSFAEEDDFSFELEELSPEQKARNEAHRRELSLPTSWLELGSHWVNDDSFKFGDFTGLEDEGFEILGNLDLRRRAPWDSDETWHWRLRGANLGLRSRSLRAEGGLRGLFDAWIEFRELPKFRNADVWTPYLGAGGSHLTLPPDWVAGQGTSGFLNLEQSLRRKEIKHRRRNAGGGFSLVLPWDLELVARYNRETKEGRKLTSAIIGSNGGNPRAAIVPEEIDQDTQEVDVSLRWNGERGQVQFGYLLSHFDNHADSLVWDTAFLRPGGGNTWTPSASFPTGQGRKGSAPDNLFHQISASGGYDLGWNTRMSGDIALGWMRQNEDFDPYTINPVLGAAITSPLPRNSLEGEIDTTAFNLRLDSRPLPGLRLNGRFRYDDRDNDTPRDLFLYVAGDASGQGTIEAGTARVNRPNSYKLKEYSFEAGYQVWHRTELSVGYEFEEIERSFSEVAETREDIYTIGLTSRPNRYVALRLKGEHSKRDGSDYRGAYPFFKGTTAEHLATIPEEELFENHPDLRKFYQAERERDRIKASISIQPHERLSLSFAIDSVNDDYEDTDLGLLHSRMHSYTFDASFMPCDNLNTHAFYTFEEFRSRQRGHSFSGNNRLADLADPDRRWMARDVDATDTFGFGFDVSLLEGRLSFEAETLYSRSKGSIDVDTALFPTVLAPGTPTAFPDTTSHLFAVTTMARYRINETFSVRLGYTYERLDVDDWAYDGVVPTTLDRVLTTGLTSPEYAQHIIAVSAIYEFR
ncbi:MAG: MtrB/PioB family decaheme-associated outer membrane protein [Deltaproteobacteria bacterium]|nr:MtrB/PioB family decaheme-associated outer membrane protein [Deltaproteobacteria bacterium]MBW2420784.1 MtrB/PioB family decaheme-associated outer membrane protein [Deltaproteobacteria bacterium]